MRCSDSGLQRVSCNRERLTGQGLGSGLPWFDSDPCSVISEPGRDEPPLL